MLFQVGLMKKLFVNGHGIFVSGLADLAPQVVSASASTTRYNIQSSIQLSHLLLRYYEKTGFAKVLGICVWSL